MHSTFIIGSVFLVGWLVAGTAAAPPPRELKIMPLGDSITRGATIPGDVPGGYRTRLYQVLTKANVTVHFVGGEETNPDPKNLPEPHHEGHSGWRIDQLDGTDSAGKIDHHFIDDAMKKFDPDLVLIHLATNDIVQGFGVKGAPKRLDDLISRIVEDKPEVQIIVAAIIPIKNPKLDEQVNEYNRAVAALVKHQAAAKHHVSGVDMHSSISVNDFADPYHPNRVGYDRMGEIWGRAILHLPARSVREAR